ncbi:MAG: hypothetical protein IJT21_10695 [Synergistaceae bacterium]|nr:hypothetical protein [Synergistaceae bacterium]
MFALYIYAEANGSSHLRTIGTGCKKIFAFVFTIKAIIYVKGGYSSARILSRLNYKYDS